MVFHRRWLLIVSLLVLGGGQIFAATREERAYATAVADFQTDMWSRAETEFAQFRKNYPKSTNVPMAVLLEAQSQYQQKKYAEMVALLDARRGQAGKLADQYALWTGEALFASEKYLQAAGTFAALEKNFPESPLRLRAVIASASAHQRLQDWKSVSALLDVTNGVFLKKAELDAANELVVRGRLLLAQAKYSQQDFSGAAAQLAAINPQALKPELEWQRLHLLCDVKIAAGDLESAFAASTNLSRIAQLEKDVAHRAESVAMRAGILEKLGRTADASAAYQENLAPGTPDEWQRQAVLKIADLSSSLGRFADAERAQEDFLRQFPNSPQAPVARLTLGELHLKEWALSPTTNQLIAAQEQFTLLLSQFPNSPHVGRAFLNRGWCRWLAGDATNALADFRAATGKNLSREDLAVARFKVGDVLFAQGDFRGALESYNAVRQQFSGETAAEKDLSGRALYQCLRARLALGEVAAAGEVFEHLFQKYSDGDLGQNSVFLYGESLVKPAEARALFERLASTLAGTPVEPRLQLVIARTYEQEQAWPAAVTNYVSWRQNFATNSLRPQADYALALAHSRAGNEDQALVQFTQFVAQNPTNLPLAPLAQWWIADHYFRAGQYIGAETNYEAVYQNRAWKNSSLYYPAQLMSGRAAMGRTGYKDAVGYFKALMSDTNCTDEFLIVQAKFACGAALMHMDSSDPNVTAANLQTATNLFSQIITAHPTNELGARAWGELADGALLLGDFAFATNAYAQVFAPDSPADIVARSRAQVGRGIVFEKLAAQSSNGEQTNMLRLALDDYLEVFNGENLRSETIQDPFWTKKAGLQAAPLVGKLNQPAAQKKFYERLKTLLPQIAADIDKKIAALAVEKN